MLACASESTVTIADVVDALKRNGITLYPYYKVIFLDHICFYTLPMSLDYLFTHRDLTMFITL